MTTATKTGNEPVHNDLIHDVEESLRQERIETLWKEYGPYIIAGAVLAVLFTGIISGWQTWRARTNAAATSALMEAFSADAAGIPAAIDKARPYMDGGQSVMADFSAAGVLLNEGKKEEALRYYRHAAGDESVPALYRNLAELLSIRLEWSLYPEQEKADGFLKRLDPLMNDAKSPWRWHAHMQAALIAAHSLNDYATARKHLEPVLQSSGADIPPSLKERARTLDHVYEMAAENKDSKKDNNKEEPEG